MERPEAAEHDLRCDDDWTPAEREEIARTGHERYTAGESWTEIASDLDLHPGSLRRIVMALHPVEFRRWGQHAAADSAEVTALRRKGESIPAIAVALSCSQTAVRTALESAGVPAQTRYPRLSTLRTPTDAELLDLQHLYEACPEAQRSRPGHRDTGGELGVVLAAACLALVEDGVPMPTLSTALDHGPTWVHWLLERHDLRPEKREIRSTRRRTREPGEDNDPLPA